MKGTVPKIRIKPRSQPPAADTPEAQTPAEDPVVSSADQGTGLDDVMDLDDVSTITREPTEEPQDQPQSPVKGEDDNATVDESIAGGDEDAEDDKEGSAVGTSAPKRGRPRGRGKGATTAGGGTARTRGRARAKGKARGKALTIKLPKRGDEEDGEDEAEGEADGEAAAGTPQAEPAAAAEEEEGPVGGGKPFRRIQGKAYVIDGDEFITEDDPKGDEKIDKWGNLLGGRKFKASTFILPNRHPQRQYMLAIDAARTSGFRDSLYYFRRNLLAFKLNATQPEKDYLIEQGKLGSHLRTRSVTLVTARSAFKLHGSKMVIDGRWVVDDYYEDKVLEEITAKGLKAGDPVGELPDPNAAHHNNELNALTGGVSSAIKGERGSGGGAGIYRAGGPTTIFGGSGWGPYSDGPLNAVRKSVLSRDGVTEENWMWMFASKSGESDEEWAKLRKEALKAGLAEELALAAGQGSVGGQPGQQQPVQTQGQQQTGINALKREVEEGDGEEDEQMVDVDSLEPKAKKKKVGFQEDRTPIGIYEPHTGLIYYRSDTQPTKSRWELLPESTTKKRILGGTKTGNGAWGIAWVDTILELPKRDRSPSPAAIAREKLLQEVREAERERQSEIPQTPVGVVDLTAGAS
ncbi:hypothetical protein AX16_003816 [Volvariella volvacea WC 439]|nr:hypothetical protein AX16_003816 [Volvariella volvacea WC 439]